MTHSITSDRRLRNSRWPWLIAALAMCTWAPAALAQTTLVSQGATWKYLDDGSDQGTAWRVPAFPDATWASGAAQFGYGDGDEATVISFGPNANDKYITTYFRHAFNVTDPSLFSNLEVNLLRDDGAVVYLNGSEVYRSNMPGGTIDYLTFSSSTVSGAGESTFYQQNVSTGLLVPGNNVIAVELHQRDGLTSDAGFDLEVVGSTTDVLIPAGAGWLYLDDGSDQGTAWQARLFADGGWSSGDAQLGYGDGDETTVVSFGPNASDKYVTTYFRYHFNITSLAGINALNLRLLRDDGAVVYLNGTEVRRDNMPAGAFDYQTLATSVVDLGNEDIFFETTFASTPLVVGDNVLAVEIHQQRVTSSDISFDVELLVDDGLPDVVRGPYLQQATPTSMIVRWRTDMATDTRVKWGDAPGNLVNQMDDVTGTTEHEMEITGLSPDTAYFYSVGSTSGVLQGDDADHFFYTALEEGACEPMRIWAIGDSGTANINAANVYNAYRTFTGSAYTDVWLMLGDNAYSSGTDPEYEAAVFDMYPELLRQTPVWPTLGNHDAVNADSPTESGVYYSIFTLPRNGESGGMMSTTEAYYSFDYGNVHFICLDSADTSLSGGGAMMTWLMADLGDTLADWVIAYFHHPPYSKGSHDSDDPGDSNGRLVAMRETFLPVLEAAGVDLVLSGHSHSYERSYFIDGAHGYGDSTPDFVTLDADGHILDAGDGQELGDGVYTKASSGPTGNEGTVYIVAGSSGKVTGTLTNHPVMHASLYELGSVVLDIDGANRLDATFLDDAGAALDAFSIVKGAGEIPGDVDRNGFVDITDLLAVLAQWGPCFGCPEDSDHDCQVDVTDLLTLLANWS